jgi:uncharacterized membrane protein
MGWYHAALGASLCVTVHYLLLRAASGRVPDALGALILEGTAALGILGYYLLYGAARGTQPVSSRGVAFAAMSGLAISGASVLLFAALRRGGPVAATGTIVMGGGVALSALLAPFLFGETLNVRRVVGVGLGMCAMVVLAWDGVRAEGP